MDYKDYFIIHSPVMVLLRKAGVTQKEAARAMGVAQSSISKAKRRKVTVDFLYRLCKALGYTLQIRFLKSDMRFRCDTVTNYFG